MVVAADSAATWTDITSPKGTPEPPALPGGQVEMAWDATGDYGVLVDSGTVKTNDSQNYTTLSLTWTFSDGVWTNVTSSAGLIPADGFALYYNPYGPYVEAMFGTYNASAFIGSHWVNIGVLSGFEDFRGPAALHVVYDAADGYLFATNGYFSYWSTGGNWTEFCGKEGDVTNCTQPAGPTPVNAATAGYAATANLTYDAADGYALYYLPSRSLTWKFSDGNWTNLTPTLSASPGSLYQPSMAYDNATQSVILFGGEANPESNSTWSYSDGGWVNITGAIAPPGRQDFAMVGDPNDGGVLMFGGEIIQLSSDEPEQFLNDTWILSASPPISSVGLSVNPTVPLPGQSAQLTANFRGGISPYNYYWKFGDGTTSTLAAPTHAFSTVGIYVVDFYLNDSAGHSAFASFNVSVYVPLQITVLSASPNPAALGEQVNLTSTVLGGTPPYTYAWAFGDGETGGNLPDISHVYSTDGPFVARLTVTDAVGGEAQRSVNITVSLSALAGSNISAGVSPLTVSFVGAGEGGVPPYSYSWDFGDGSPISHAQSPTHTYATAGVYLVTETVTDNRSESAQSTLTVRVTGPSGSGGITSPEWKYGFVLTASGLVAVGVAWGVDRLVRRGRRAQGEEWIREISESGRATGPSGPR